MTKEQAEHALDDACLKLLTWKPSVTQAVAVAVVKRGLENYAHPFWPDSVDTSFVADADTACKGIAYKLLIKAGVIEKTGEFRRSELAASKGRTVFRYRVTNGTMARTFLKRNGGGSVAEPQRELFQ